MRPIDGETAAPEIDTADSGLTSRSRPVEGASLCARFQAFWKERTASEAPFVLDVWGSNPPAVRRHGRARTRNSSRRDRGACNRDRRHLPRRRSTVAAIVGLEDPRATVLGLCATGPTVTCTVRIHLVASVRTPTASVACRTVVRTMRSDCRTRRSPGRQQARRPTTRSRPLTIAGCRSRSR